MNEIKDSLILRIYGACLSLIFFFECLYWHSYGFAEKLSRTTEAICWPFLRDCADFRFFSSTQWTWIFIVLAVFSVFNAILFLRKKTKIAYYGLILILVLAFGIILLDYRTRLNQNIMIFFTIFSFLFVSRKSASIPWVILSFYFWAGILKLRPEWLSGMAIPGELWLVPESLKTYAAKYVIVLEIVFIWALLFRRRSVQVFILIQLGLFHLVSLSVVGFFYPVLMFLILSLFPLRSWLEPEPESTRRISPGAMMVVGVIAFLNIWPHFVPGDKAVTGEARILSLHMFDSRTLCRPQAFIHWKGRELETRSLNMPNVARIRCDPIVFLSRLRTLCRSLKMSEGFDDIDFKLETKHVGQNVFKTVVDVKNVCQNDPGYSIWGFNDWIIK